MLRILPLLFLSLSVHASLFEKDYYLEETDFNKSIDYTAYKNISSILKTHFDPIIISKGGELEIILDTVSSRINATASRVDNLWKIKFFGGMLNHRLMNKNLFTAILCHELGHHIAGAPLKKARSHSVAWVSVEGQADYFTTNICLKKLYLYSDNETFVKRVNVNSFIKRKCESTSSTLDESYLCQRLLYVSEELGRFIVKIKAGRRGSREPVPRFSKPDIRKVKSTMEQHPMAQCRLDSFFQGTLCQDFYISNDLKNCKDIWGDHLYGARPRCWYAPSF